MLLRSEPLFAFWRSATVLVAAWVCLASVLGGCRAAATELVVVVATNYRAPDELGFVHVTVRDGNGDVVGTSDLTVVRSEVPAGEGQVHMPFSFAVAPRGGDATRRVTVEVEAYPSRGGALLSIRRAVTGFRASQKLVLPMFIDRACGARASPCPPSETCAEQGECQSAQVPVEGLSEATPGRELLDLDAGSGADAVAPPGTCGERLGGCNPVTNVGCPAGQACFLERRPEGLVAVCGIVGGRDFGSECDVTQDCRAGFACLVLGDGLRHCTKLCCAPGDTARCRDTATGGHPEANCNQSLAEIGLMACTVPVRCNYFTQDCRGNQNCIPDGVLRRGLCVPLGSGVDGALCRDSAACARGFVCIAREGFEPQCRRACEPGALPSAGPTRVCPPEFQCFMLNGGPDDFGVCLPRS